MKNKNQERNRAVRITALCGALALAIGSGLLTGCAKVVDMVEVRCVAVHIYGSSPAAGTMSERFTYMTAERTDTKERRNFVQVLGQPGDTFRMNWNQRYYE